MIKTIAVSVLIRPRVIIEEIKNPDGSRSAGRWYWHAVKFETDVDINDIIGRHDLIRLQFNCETCEIWQFKNSHIMLDGSSQLSWTYIMTYDEVNRV